MDVPVFLFPGTDSGQALIFYVRETQALIGTGFLFQQFQQILTIPVLFHGRAKGFKLFIRNVARPPGNLLRAGDFQPLPTLQDFHKTVRPPAEMRGFPYPARHTLFP
jgi:hypothetical protein